MVQRAEAEGRRRLGPRLMHTKETVEALKLEIQQKKEALYDVISKAEKSSKTSTWAHMRLYQHLAVEITPRPHDSVWCHVQSGRRVCTALKRAGLITLPFVVSSWSEYCEGYLKKLAPAMMMEEEHEARSHLLGI